jgi:hypothetical protein
MQDLKTNKANKKKPFQTVSLYKESMLISCKEVIKTWFFVRSFLWTNEHFNWNVLFLINKHYNVLLLRWVFMWKFLKNIMKERERLYFLWDHFYEHYNVLLLRWVFMWKFLKNIMKERKNVNKHNIRLFVFSLLFILKLFFTGTFKSISLINFWNLGPFFKVHL